LRYAGITIDGEPIYIRSLYIFEADAFLINTRDFVLKKLIKFNVLYYI